MKNIIESQVLEHPDLLEEAWVSDETFAFLPDKRGLDGSWLDAAWASLPDNLRKGHFILFTSGSTGHPKLIVGEKVRSESLALALHGLQESEPVQETVVVLPLSYCYAFVNQWLWARVMKRTLRLTVGLKHPNEMAEALEGASDAMVCLVGAQVPMLLQHFPQRVFPGVIRLHFAGGPFPQRHVEPLKRCFPNARIFNNYGCAEAMPRLTLRPLEDSDDGANIGRALPGVQMKVGPDSEILFRSPYRGVAHYDSEGWRVIPDQAWIPSGDLGEPLDGGYWKITGRNNEVFKRFGEKIALPRLLKTVFQVWSGQAAFYRDTDAHGEQAHVLVLSPKPSAEELQGVQQGFRKQWPRTHWPVRIETAVRLPLLENGKIDVAELARHAGNEVLWQQRI